MNSEFTYLWVWRWRNLWCRCDLGKDYSGRKQWTKMHGKHPLLLSTTKLF